MQLADCRGCAQLTGTIPDWIGNMTELREMKIRANKVCTSLCPPCPHTAALHSRVVAVAVLAVRGVVQAPDLRPQRLSSAAKNALR